LALPELEKLLAMDEESAKVKP